MALYIHPDCLLLIQEINSYKNPFVVDEEVGPAEQFVMVEEMTWELYPEKVESTYLA